MLVQTAASATPPCDMCCVLFALHPVLRVVFYVAAAPLAPNARKSDGDVGSWQSLDFWPSLQLRMQT